MTKNEHVCATCCRPEVDCDVISGRKVRTDLGYIVINFEVASYSSFRDIKKNHFVTVADIEDSIKRKRIRVFRLKNIIQHQQFPVETQLCFMKLL